jgi:SLOG cluster3 family
VADRALRSVFLSASFPSGERGELVRPYDPDGIADAVTALANAVFASNGRIVFGGHPTITPLVLRMAAQREFRDTVDVYQSEYFRDGITEATLELETRGYGHIEWVEEGPSLETSLRELRRRMFSRDDLVGAIFVGGMEGIEEEFRMFGKYRENLPRIPLAGPGGMAARVAQDHREELLLPVELLERLDSRRYPVLAGLIVRLLAEQPESGLSAESEVLRPTPLHTPPPPLTTPPESEHA